MSTLNLLSLSVKRGKVYFKKATLALFITIFTFFTINSNVFAYNNFDINKERETSHTYDFELDKDYQKMIDVCKISESYTQASTSSDLEMRFKNLYHLAERDLLDLDFLRTLNNRAYANFKSQGELKKTSLWKGKKYDIGAITFSVYDDQYFANKIDKNDGLTNFYYYEVNDRTTNVKEILFITYYYGVKRKQLQFPLGGAFFADNGKTCIIFEANYDK